MFSGFFGLATKNHKPLEIIKYLVTARAPPHSLSYTRRLNLSNMHAATTAAQISLTRTPLLPPNLI